tara:strand:+ start:3679 stop:4428 length:750 start_codon:yes stop_codon:yes gene_type:complete
MTSAKKIFSKIIGWFGYKLFNKNYVKNLKSLSKDSKLNLDYILGKIFERNNIQSLVQIGANDGLRFDHLKKYLYDKNLKAILVEPVPKYFKKLSDNYFGFENIILENYAISETNSITSIYCVRDQYLENYSDHIKGINSFDINHLTLHGVNKKHIEKISVKTIKLSELINKHSINNLDLLYIDAEGYDANIVLDFLSDNLMKPIIIFEYIHINNILLDKVIQKLLEKKYSFFEVKENLVCTPENKIPTL